MCINKLSLFCTKNTIIKLFVQNKWSKFWCKNVFGSKLLGPTHLGDSFRATIPHFRVKVFAGNKRLEFWNEHGLGAKLLGPKQPWDSFHVKASRAYFI